MSDKSIQQAFSWTVISDQRIVKQIDKSVVLYKTTGIPVEIRWFFTLEQLSPGEKENVTFLYEGNHYDAFFSMGVQESPRTRLVWRSDFSSVIQNRFPNLYRGWKHDNEDPDKSGYIVFKRKSADLYEVFLDTLEIT